MSTTASRLAPAQPVVLSPRRFRRGLVAAAAGGTLVVIVGIGASPATAAPGMLPVVRGGFTVAAPASPLSDLRAALEAAPDHARIPIGQILRNVAQDMS